MFWLYAVLLLIVSLAFVVYPFLRKPKQDEELDRSQENLRAYRDGEQDLKDQLENELLTQEEHDQLLQELKLQLLGDSEIEVEEFSNSKPRPWIYLGVGVVATAVIGLGMYNQYGAIDDVRLREAMLVQHESPEKTMAFLKLYEEALEKTPGDVEGWFQLGSTYLQINLPGRAIRPFQMALDGAREQGFEQIDVANLMSRLAQARYFASNRQLDAETVSLLANAEALDPDNVLVLGILGMSAFEKGEWELAIEKWRKLAGLVTPEERQQIMGGIQAAEQELIAQGKEVPKFEENLTAVGPGVRVKVTIDPSVADKVSEAQSLFILARIPNGPPMPLAVMRLPASLPAEVVLDDRAKMGPMAGISSAPEVEIVARLSMSGRANPESGDIQGVSSTIAPAEDAPVVEVVISEIVE